MTTRASSRRVSKRYVAELRTLERTILSTELHPEDAAHMKKQLDRMKGVVDTRVRAYTLFEGEA